MDARTFRTELAQSSTLKVMASLRSRLLQPSGAIGGLRASSQDRTTLLSLAADNRDRMPSDQFLLTQEFLGMMLGVQRPSVSLVMNALRAAGAIRYARGRVTIINRQALLDRVCECYQISRNEFDRLLGDTPTSPRLDKMRRRNQRTGITAF